jgi:hypothetical protein
VRLLFVAVKLLSFDNKTSHHNTKAGSLLLGLHRIVSHLGYHYPKIDISTEKVLHGNNNKLFMRNFSSVFNFDLPIGIVVSR